MPVDFRKYPKHLVMVPETEWPDGAYKNNRPEQVWLSRFYLVQVFNEGEGVTRVTVNKTTRKHGKWDQDIPWDVLQDIKDQIGMGDKYAIEVYPRNEDIVNVANMRHLWVLPEPLNIGWFGE